MFNLRLYIAINFHRLHNFLLKIEDFLLPQKVKIPNEKELDKLLNRGVTWYTGSPVCLAEACKRNKIKI